MISVDGYLGVIKNTNNFAPGYDHAQVGMFHLYLHQSMCLILKKATLL